MPVQNIHTITAFQKDFNNNDKYDAYSAILNVAVLENVPVGYNVTTLSASDPDGSSDGMVFYELEGNSSVSFYHVFQSFPQNEK